ncbi:MAG TPA: GspE/PulE family protein [Patescibacteria group bacterium]|nr:GspE/PulE family protein [Patescibacteria group bacterium]
MSDLSSIDDLLAKGKAASDPVSSLTVSSGEVAEKFSKKMGQVQALGKEEEAKRLALKVGLPHLDLEKFPVSQEALRQIDREEAERLKTVCFYATQEEFRLGTVNPTDEVQQLMTDLVDRRHADGGLYVISENSLQRILKLYNTLPTIKPITKDLEIKETDLDKVKADVTDLQSFQSLLVRRSVSDLLVLLIGAGLKMEASDVHVEAEEGKIVARFRLDGILHDAAELPKEEFRQLVSRIKLLSSLKINITDKPQDGRFTIKLANASIDVRVSTIPTIYGESVVMRLLDQSRKGLSFEKIGLQGDAFEKLKAEIARPNGMVITTGPTGSGKTTTLYSILEVLNKPGVKIITLEDPVEYKMEGINQSQIDHSRGYNFASGLRSILRQDPDIVMVGEIRDLETAEVAIQAALTGHLLFSTIHTNSASGAIPRFLSMGVKPFLLAPALNAIMGQRLVRLLCPECKKEAQLSETEQAQVEKIISSMPEKERGELQGKKITLYTNVGCEHCGGIGYKGRTGIYEILRMNSEIEQIILSGGVSEYEIEKIAVKNGMVTMVQDGLLKALAGQTSLEEVLRVID